MQSIHLGAKILTGLTVRHVVFRMRCLRVQRACQPSFISEAAVQLRREQSTDRDPLEGKLFILWRRTYWSRALAARSRSQAVGTMRTFAGAQSLTLSTASRLAMRNALDHTVGRGTTLGAMSQLMSRNAMARPWSCWRSKCSSIMPRSTRRVGGQNCHELLATTLERRGVDNPS